MKIIFILSVLFVCDFAAACSMRISQPFRPIDYKYVDHTIYAKEIIQFRVPTLKIENIHLNKGGLCPSYLSAELSIPADSPYTFQELGVYFRLSKEDAEKIDLIATPVTPLSISNPKLAKFIVLFKLKKKAFNFMEPFIIEVLAIDSHAEIGNSNFVRAKLL